MTILTKKWTQIDATLAAAAVAALAAVVSGVLSYYANVHAINATLEATRATNLLESAKLADTERSERAEMNIKAYELVERTLSIDPALRKQGHGIAAAAIINALTEPPLRNDLQNALSAGITDLESITAIDKARRFDAEDSFLNSKKQQTPQANNSVQKASPPIALLSFSSPAWAASPLAPLEAKRVDIFYCEAAEKELTIARRTQANDARAQLLNDAKGTGINVRLLPILVQARPEYQTFLDEIRYKDVRLEDAAISLAMSVKIDKSFVHRTAFKISADIGIFYCAKK